MAKGLEGGKEKFTKVGGWGINVGYDGSKGVVRLMDFGKAVTSRSVGVV